MQHFGQVKLLDLLLQPARQTRIHGTPTRQDDVLVQLRSDIHWCSLNGVEEHFGATRLFYVDKGGLEHAFWRFETFSADFDYSAIWELCAKDAVSVYSARQLIYRTV